ncbi:MAG TPA: DUF4178 domain-containing protein, partial [Candidatus Saccharimonadales bacterium]
YGGVVYKRNDFGEGKYTSTGDTGVNASGVVEFVEFIAPNGEKYISFERFDDNDFTLSLGEKLLPSALHRHPGQNSPL